MASAFGPRVPWLPGLPPGIQEWTPDNDPGSSITSTRTGRQAHDLAAEMPEKLAQMREMFAIEAAETPCSRSAAACGCRLPPRVAHLSAVSRVGFLRRITRMPEFCAPALGNKNNIVTIDADVPADANGVLYALGGFAGGVTCYLDDGILCYEYNLFILSRTKIRSTTKLPPGPVTIVVETRYAEQRPAGPLNIIIKVGQEVVARDGCRSARRCCLPPTTASTSASVSARR